MFALRGAVEIAFEVLGDGEPVLLLAGNGRSAAYWPDEFCALLRGRVIRYDYRDTGASTRGTHYDLDELAADALAVLDAADVERAHLIGLSMGGFLTRRIALWHPDRVRTLSSILSTPDYSVMLHSFCGGPAPTSGLPPPSSAWLAAVGQIPPDADILLESLRLPTARVRRSTRHSGRRCSRTPARTSPSVNCIARRACARAISICCRCCRSSAFLLCFSLVVRIRSSPSVMRPPQPPRSRARAAPPSEAWATRLGLRTSQQSQQRSSPACLLDVISLQSCSPRAYRPPRN